MTNTFNHSLNHYSLAHSVIHQVNHSFAKSTTYPLYVFHRLAITFTLYSRPINQSTNQSTNQPLSHRPVYEFLLPLVRLIIAFSQLVRLVRQDVTVLLEVSQVALLLHLVLTQHANPARHNTVNTSTHTREARERVRRTSRS